MRLSDRFIELMQMEKEEVATIVTDLEDTLNEIEEICDFNYTKENTRILANEILQLIKQAKEGGEWIK